MGDRNQKNSRKPQGKQAANRQSPSLEQRPFQALKGFKVGPVCLKCNEVINLKRQSTGNGYVHSACEPKRGQMPVLYVMKSGEDDLQLVKVAATEELAEVSVEVA